MTARKKVLAASGNAPRGVAVDLPEAERAALAAQITPHLAGLEDLRLETLNTVDRRARLLVPLIGAGVFIALLAGGQAIVTALIFGVIAAVAGWFIAMGNRSASYQAAVKTRFATVTSAHLSGFDHLVKPETDLAHLRSWHLFPDLQSAETLDRIKGARDGRSLALSEMSVAHASVRRGKLDHTLTLSVVEMASGAIDGAVIVLTPKDAPPRLLESQASASDLPAGATGDAAFDATYTLRLNPPEAADQLSPALRTAILDLGSKGPAGRP